MSANVGIPYTIGAIFLASGVAQAAGWHWFWIIMGISLLLDAFIEALVLFTKYLEKGFINDAS